MKETSVVVSLALAAALAAACSSTTLTPTDAGPQTYVISGTCGPLPVEITNPLLLTGPCDLGAAGEYTLDAGLMIQIGHCGATPVQITADWIQGSSVLHSTFVGNAEVPCDAGVSGTFPIGGTFTYAGGTGPFVDATGSADVDGGVAYDTNPAIGPANLTLSGSLTY